MTNSLPYSFVPGTKARAQEVNANFLAVMETVNSMANQDLSNISSNALDIIKNNTSIRNLGEIFCSLFPLTDSGLHLLDGSLLRDSGIYSDFISYISNLYKKNSEAPKYFCTESEWQNSVTKYGVCGKFVYDKSANTVRLPKVTGFVEGTTDTNNIGAITEAGLPNHTHTRGTMNITGNLPDFSNSGTPSGAFSKSGFSNSNNAGAGQYLGNLTVYFNAANSWSGNTSNPVYENSSIKKANTVQPQSIKVFYYIVVATSSKTQIQVNLDNFATDLNNKADTDLSNAVPSKAFAVAMNSSGIRTVTETYQNESSGYRLWSDGWCEQWGHITPASAWTTVTFLKPFRNTNYSVSGTCTANNSSAVFTAGSKTTSGFSLYKNTATDWKAEGYIS